jgi:putative PIG3 family NAD(P)H quinone oxidoreductase
MPTIATHQPGGPEVLHVIDRPVPFPHDNEVLIKVEAAGVNRPDILQRRGFYAPPNDASPVLGLEVAGEIVALGPHTAKWAVGDKVCALVHGGGYAGYVAAHQDHCLPIPNGWTIAEAAALPETLFTVWANLINLATLKANEWVLIHGGTSGVGMMAIQVAKNWGAKVITTSSSDEKCRACLKIGADFALRYNQDDFEQQCLRLTDNKGVNVVLDIVGGDNVEKNLQVMAHKGRHISVGLMGGATASISLFTIMQKRLILTGSVLRSRSVEEKSQIAQQIHQQLWPLIERGAIKPVLDQIFPFTQVINAHQRMESGQHIGKIVLTLV